MHVALDAEKITTVGVTAIGNFLKRLNIFKAVADVSSSRDLYAKYTAVDDQFIQLRNLVLEKKKPRRVFVQSRTVLNAEQHVELVEYEPSSIGLIQSFIDRFTN